MRLLHLTPFVLLVACAGRPGGEPPPPARAAPALPSPAVAEEAPDHASDEELPIIVRRLLQPRMVRHGQDFAALHVTVKNEHLEDVARIAGEIADEPMIARPAEGQEDTLNARLPPAFFTHQDALRERATVLADAAEAGDVSAVRRAYDDLGATCSACHQRWFPLPDVP